MVVLVTGAAGFLGQRLCKWLVDQGDEVRALVRRESQVQLFQNSPIQAVLGDIRDPQALATAMKGCEGVYHLAALASDWTADPRDFYKVNFQGTLNVLAAARQAGVERTVVTSTMGTIGPPDPEQVHPVDESHVRWVNFFTEYAASKLMAEERIGHLVRQGQNIVVVNPTRIFGPGAYDRKNGLLILMDHYLNRPFAIAPGSPNIIGNYVYLDDVCQGHRAAMLKGITGEKYILGGQNLTFTEFFASVSKVAGQKGRFLPIPFGVLKVLAFFGAIRAKLFRKQPLATFSYIRKLKYQWPVSSQKAEQDLGYRITELEEALRESLNWLSTYKQSRKKPTPSHRK